MTTTKTSKKADQQDDVNLDATTDPAPGALDPTRQSVNADAINAAVEEQAEAETARPRRRRLTGQELAKATKDFYETGRGRPNHVYRVEAGRLVVEKPA